MPVVIYWVLPDPESLTLSLAHSGACFCMRHESTCHVSFPTCNFIRKMSFFIVDVLKAGTSGFGWKNSSFFPLRSLSPFIQILNFLFIWFFLDLEVCGSSSDEYFISWMVVGTAEKTLCQDINLGFYPMAFSGWRSHCICKMTFLSIACFHPCFPPVLHSRSWVRESDTSQGTEGERRWEEVAAGEWRQMENDRRANETARKRERGVDQ